MKQSVKNAILVILVCIALLITAFVVSPWPSVLVIRKIFNSGAEKANQQLEQFVPTNSIAIENLQYDPSDKDAFLSAYLPNNSNSGLSYPVIVWIHGGGLISGRKEDIANYCKILSSKGFVAITIDYTIAPEGKYPTPLRQTNSALSYIIANAAKFRADTSCIILAGDSGGSMIAAQVANIIYNEDYAQLTKIKPAIASRQLKGLLLYCGIYDIRNIKLEGPFGYFMKTVFWSYLGKKDISTDTYAQSASVFEHIDTRFPPSFISAGNGDPLLSQSLALSRKLSKMDVPVDSLFFPQDFQPVLPHEYQFSLHSAAGKQALDRSLVFLSKLKQE